MENILFLWVLLDITKDYFILLEGYDAAPLALQRLEENYFRRYPLDLSEIFQCYALTGN